MTYPRTCYACGKPATMPKAHHYDHATKTATTRCLNGVCTRQPGESMIVVDLGCAAWGEALSIDRLIEQWQPDVLFGFDPHCQDGVWRSSGTVIVQRQAAAWIHDEGVDWIENGSSSGVADTPTPASVSSFDLAAFVELLPSPVVLKLDIEGSEYKLLPEIHGRALDAHPLNRILVEWHGEPLDLPWRCPVEAWE